ncbi:nucleoside diphosphate kinase [Jimgerdemannia flammicorona]|uniref:Nucleoside diphosphate kinase n=1 Tax=Jimgerdemannia flammicorona TaxID=994334 RepID=A0A433D8F2_9FUNG|nr:nucleoside diphosphate kinase [Jimgerdemannia flammicorona]
MLARAAIAAVSRAGASSVIARASIIQGRAFSTATRANATSGSHFLTGVATAVGVIGAVGSYSYYRGEYTQYHQPAFVYPSFINHSLSYIFFQRIATHSPILAETKPLAGIKNTASERTFIAVKPDGVQRGLVGKIVSRFEERGYKLVAIKAVVPSRALAEEHYADLRARPFFRGLVEYMTNGKAPVVAMVWEGKDVVRQGRAMIGATNPLESSPGSIRGQYCVGVPPS